VSPAEPPADAMPIYIRFGTDDEEHLIGWLRQPVSVADAAPQLLGALLHDVARKVETTPLEQLRGLLSAQDGSGQDGGDGDEQLAPPGVDGP